MRFVLIENAQPNMVVGADLFDFAGRLLVSRGMLLTDEYISRMNTLGVIGVYIDDEYSKGIDIEPAIPLSLRAEGMSAIEKGNLEECQSIAQKIVEHITSGEKISLDMTDLRTFDNYTYAHSLNVGVLACVIGIGLEYDEKLLEDLVLAALLHDIGKLGIPIDILNKPGYLSKEEFALIKTHSQVSYELIRSRIDLSPYVKQAVLSHHENEDGTGYPSGLKGDSIGKLAKVLHVADVYDALTSKRPYKEPYSPYAAVEILLSGSGTLYDPKALDAFLRYIPVYPKGTEITLQDGRRAIVINNEGERGRRPIIRTEDMEEIDLADPKAFKFTIRTPSEQEYFDIISREGKRSEMIEPLKRLKILFLDPSGQTYKDISSALSYLHDFVHVTSDAKARIYVQNNGFPDFIIADIDSRDMNDIEKIKRMNTAAICKCPVLLLGSYSDANTIKTLGSIGIFNYVLKPFEMHYIQEEIKRLKDLYDCQLQK